MNRYIPKTYSINLVMYSIIPAPVVTMQCIQTADLPEFEYMIPLNHLID